jgi:hypothetical protein
MIVRKIKFIPFINIQFILELTDLLLYIDSLWYLNQTVRLEVLLRSYSACFASTKPWVKPQSHKKKNHIKPSIK